MCEIRLAQVLAKTGDRDAAFDKLSKLVNLPFSLNYGDDLRDDPRLTYPGGVCLPLGLTVAPRSVPSPSLGADLTSRLGGDSRR